MGEDIGGNRNLIPTSGPLLRTLVSLCVKPIVPRRDSDIWVSFNFRCNNDTDDDVVDKGY